MTFSSTIMFSLKDRHKGEGSSLNSTSLRISAGLRCAGLIPFRPRCASPNVDLPAPAPPHHTLSPTQRIRPPIMKLRGGVVPISAFG